MRDSANNSYRVELNGKAFDVRFDDENATITIDGETYSLEVKSMRAPDMFSMLLGEQSITLAIEDGDSLGRYRIQAGGSEFSADVVTSREAHLREFIRSAGTVQTTSRVRAPMPGMIIKNLVDEGDKVHKGQGITIMEAMKMENEIKSPVSGVVKRLAVQPGDSVEKGQFLFELE